jgi:membrane carboxypeptidase/penicillin-binding protein
MKEALSGRPVEDFPVPEGVVVVPVDLSASGSCVKPVMMAFLAGTEPMNTCGPSRGRPKSDSPAVPGTPPTEAATGAAPTASAQTPKPPVQGP